MPWCNKFKLMEPPESPWISWVDALELLKAEIPLIGQFEITTTDSTEISRLLWDTDRIGAKMSRSSDDPKQTKTTVLFFHSL